MSSGIVQLVCIGAQDEHIVGDPEISFFNSSYKRHSNFSQSIEKQTIHGAVKNNSLSTIRIERSGDLLGYTYFVIDNGSEAKDTNNWGSLIESVQLVIGGQIIDEQDSTFCENIAVDMLAPNVSKSSNGPHPGGNTSSSFFFPLRYHDIELRIRWGSGAASYNWECYSNYYYLDNEERGNMASRSHDMLIYQVQKNIGSAEHIQNLNFNHPVKFIASSNNSGSSPLASETNRIKLSINGVDLTTYRWSRPHFIDVSHYYHTNYVTSPDIFMHSFCLTTSLHQPTGSLNLSRIENAKIHSETEILNDTIYAVNYNILRIENGMAGLVYAN